jgi:hypothetical protein
VGWKIVRRRNNGYKFLVYDAVMGRVHFRMNLKKEEDFLYGATGGKLFRGKII